MVFAIVFMAYIQGQIILDFFFASYDILWHNKIQSTGHVLIGQDH
jgi:hypothetical protein